jgi:hypothetical protein
VVAAGRDQEDDMIAIIAGRGAAFRPLATLTALVALAAGAVGCAGADDGPALGEAASALCPAGGCLPPEPEDPPPPPPKPDLRAVLLNAANREPCVTKMFHVSVQNVGDAAAPPTTAHLIVNGAWQASVPVPGLAAGDSYDFWVNYVDPQQAGDDSVTIKADATRSVAEKSEFNNAVGMTCWG